METALFIYVLFLHFVSDFICQTPYQAESKGRTFYDLLDHVLVYIAILFIGLSVLSLLLAPITLPHIMCFVVVNGFLHMHVDYFTSKFMTYFWRKKNQHMFFVVLGVGQFFHVVCLAASLFLLYLG